MSGGGGDDQAVARHQRPARLRTNRRHVRTAQELPGLVLAGPVVFRLHLPQHTCLRILRFYWFFCLLQHCSDIIFCCI